MNGSKYLVVIRMVDILKGKGTQVKSNMSARVDALKVIPDNFAKEMDAIVTNMTQLKPVVAVCEAGKLLGNGVLEFIKTQADITRKWVPI